MTKIDINTGAIRCADCKDWICNYCHNSKSDHFGHNVISFHPSCTEINKRLKDSNI